jgi:16S rRNA (guanine966-N2)-methyltransferase
VEQDKAALDALRANITALGIAREAAEVRAQSVLTLPPIASNVAQPYDLIMMDPPYDSGAGAVALDKLARLGWIAPHAWVSIETSKKEVVDISGFEANAVRDHGKARLHLLRRVG